VIADDAIYKKVPQVAWANIVDEIAGHLSRGTREGLTAAIGCLGGWRAPI